MKINHLIYPVSFNLLPVLANDNIATLYMGVCILHRAQIIKGTQPFILT